jgi:hypothetical protein
MLVAIIIEVLLLSLLLGPSSTYMARVT